MNIGVYNPFWKTMGGGERVSLSIAEELNAFVISDLDLTNTAEYFGFKNVHRWIAPLKDVSEFFDLLVITTNRKPIKHNCNRYWIILQLPLNKKWSLTPRGIYRGIMRSRLISQARRAERVFVYSGFVKDVLKENFDLDCEVLYPLVKTFKPGEKKNIILSVGRFFKDGNNKRYDILIDAYEKSNIDWEYHIVGSCNDRKYLRELQSKHPKIFFHVNASHEELAKLYSEAKIFWHAAGYGTTNPEQMEHFGISTVEAMSAGCIPLVFNAGGQKEIVREEFTWNTISELLDKTWKVMQNRGIEILGSVAISDSKKFTERSLSLKELI